MPSLKKKKTICVFIDKLVDMVSVKKSVFRETEDLAIRMFVLDSERTKMKEVF